MDILNFISWIKAGKYSPTMPAGAITVIGVPNPKRGDAYLPVTVPVSAFATNIGKLLGGGIVVGEWDENGVKKALIASLTDLSLAPWAIAPYDNILIGPTAQSFSDGSGNTDAIIAQTVAPAAITYAAGIAKLHNGGENTDWYLPSIWELKMCYNAALIVNRVLGSVNGFVTNYYWSSTEYALNVAWLQYFHNGNQNPGNKSTNYNVRAVRIHNL